ncbi:ran binding protein [Toxoplasma gondii MAS]|uniref:Ran binding protein n=1 Tax=Toxoplasma gondii MAS TaxID=943118 RepID=A0A086QSY9_TOXGO|nr:ran binding protein [Toxoplasma gondii MAS]
MYGQVGGGPPAGSADFFPGLFGEAVSEAPGAFRGGPPSLRGARGGRGRGAGPPALAGRVRKEGDWECEDPACRNVNFSKRTRCNRCGRSRPKTGDPLKDIPNLGGPPGLFKHGDWPCAHCGNVNWARRSTCNICNAPRTNNQDEPRMGRGGGHFDLQDPADRNRHDSDDEDFDEFGRRKRKHVAHSSSGGLGAVAPTGQAPSAAAAAGPTDAETVGAQRAGGGAFGPETLGDAAPETPEGSGAHATAAAAPESLETGSGAGGARGAFGSGNGFEGDTVGVKLVFPPAPKIRLVSSSSESEASRSPSRSRRGHRSRSRSRSASSGRRRRRRSSSRENRRARRERDRERDRRSRSRSPRGHGGSSSSRR